MSGRNEQDITNHVPISSLCGAERDVLRCCRREGEMGEAGGVCGPAGWSAFEEFRITVWGPLWNLRAPGDRRETRTGMNDIMRMRVPFGRNVQWMGSSFEVNER